MSRHHVLLSVSCAALSFGAFACSNVVKSDGGSSDPSGSEVAVSVVSGALNNNSGTGVAMAPPRAPKRSLVDRAFAALNPIGTAYAATWMCTGDTLNPSPFKGPGDYAFTPASCSVTWINGKTASSKWNGTFTLDYGSSCDDTHAFMELQAAGCEMTRTSQPGGTTRTITGPLGNYYAIDHDTNGAGTGWDSSVSPAPTDAGVQITCGSNGCSPGAGGPGSRSLVISGSHLTGTVDGLTVWNHTVSTGADGISVSGIGAGRVVNGSVTVQHNIIHVTSTTSFDNVGYGEPGCCFPTSGAVSTTFSKGPDVSKTEKLTFSDTCGEAMLTKADGTNESITLTHCL